MTFRFAYSLLSILVLMTWLLAPAHADDQADCDQSKDAEQQIRGCTRLLNSKSLDDENMSFAYNNRGSAFRDKGDYEKAIADFNKATELLPEYYLPYYNRGYIYARKGKYDRAIAEYSLGIERDGSGLPEPYYDRALIYQKLGQPEKAIADYAASLSYSDDTSARKNAMRKLESLIRALPEERRQSVLYMTMSARKDFELGRKALEAFDYKTNHGRNKVFCEFLEDVDVADVPMSDEMTENYKKVLGEHVYYAVWMMQESFQTKEDETTSDQSNFESLARKLFLSACPDLSDLFNCNCER